jgi:hypothetical protein
LRLQTGQAQPAASFQPVHLWALLFGLWVLFLSGTLTSFLGTPGAIQAIRLRLTLAGKQEQLTRAEDELLGLQEVAEHLEKSRPVQQREIRHVLGYAAPDELIFDFTTDPSTL